MKEKFLSKDLEEILDIQRRTLFYWEKTGKIPKAKRTPMGNYRYWSKGDVEKIKRLLKG